jgi:hypothetical protein
MRRRVLVAIASAVACIVHVSPASAAIVIPAGGQAVLSGAVFAGCNSLAYGYQLNGGANQQVDAKPAFCPGGSGPPTPASGASIGPFAADQSLLIYLSDVTCGATYYSDGTGTADHGLVTGSNPFLVALDDGGPGPCDLVNVPSLPSPPSDNFQVSVMVTDPPTVSVTAPSPPAGQDGYFNIQDLASLGGSIPVSVSATGGSGVLRVCCAPTTACR